MNQILNESGVPFRQDLEFYEARGNRRAKAPAELDKKLQSLTG